MTTSVNSRIHALRVSQGNRLHRAVNRTDAHTYKHTHIHVAGVYSVSHCVNTCTGVKLFMLIDNLNPAREGWNVACHRFNSSSASVTTCKEQSTSSYIMGESAIEIADSTLSSTCMAVLPVPKCWCLLWLCLWKRSHTKYIYSLYTLIIMLSIHSSFPGFSPIFCHTHWYYMV